MVWTTSSTAPSTARDLVAQAEPHLLDARGSQATTTTLPGHAPTVFTNRSTVCGSIACGLITWPSSMPASTSSSDASIT